MYNSFNEVRNMFIDFFKSKNHLLIESSSLIPKDNSLLFTNAGMNQFKDIFLGLHKSLYKEIVTVQRCLRVGGKHNDLKNIGYTFRHNTFFEMMGNFSFDSYFKKESILYAWELLTSNKWFNLNKNKLIITVNINDFETYNIWLNILKINKNNIFLVGKKCNYINSESDNFWKMSDFGPCGYSTEIYYNINCIDNINDFLLYKDTNKYLEIWNLVFIEYNIINNNSIINLPYKSVDTGMGLERICSILQNVNSNFSIDIFLKLKKKISKFFNIKIKRNNIFVFNLISDHLRSIIFLIIDGILPSNEYRGYILRKIIRRTLTYIYLLIKNKDFVLNKLLYYLKDWFFNFYFFKKKNIFIKIKKIVMEEEKKYFFNLFNNLNLLNFYLKKLNNKNNILDGKTVFLLYDTYGLPLDIIIEFCKYNNFIVDIKKFNYFLNLQKKKSKSFSIFNKKNIFLNLNNIKKTKFIGYNINYCYSKIIYILKKNNIINFFNKYDIEIIIILSYTVLYPECGGQIGDRGIIYNNNFKFFVYNTKFNGKYIYHIGKLLYGCISINEVVKVKYDFNYRFSISCNHSACHILLYILKKNFSKKIKQCGSLIKNNYFTLDFYYDSNLDIFKIYKINRQVNKIIWKKLYFYEKLIKRNNFNKKFIFLNENNYVRIINFGNLIKDYCCGTHVENTYKINLFVIKKKYNISCNIKRIKACTNLYALKYINKNLFFLKNVCNILSINKNQIYNKIFFMKKNEIKNKKKNKLIYNILIKNILSQILLKDIINYENLNILIKKFVYNDFLNENILFNIINKIKNKFNLSLIIFILKLNNIDKLIFISNKNLTNYLNILNNNFINIKKYKIIKKNNFNIEFFNIFHLKDNFNLYKIINFIRYKLLNFNKMLLLNK